MGSGTERPLALGRADPPCHPERSEGSHGRMTGVGAAPDAKHPSAAAVIDAERVDEGGWAAEPVVLRGAGAALKPLLMLFFASVSFRIIYEKKC